MNSIPARRHRQTARSVPCASGYAGCSAATRRSQRQRPLRQPGPLALRCPGRLEAKASLPSRPIRATRPCPPRNVWAAEGIGRTSARDFARTGHFFAGAGPRPPLGCAAVNLFHVPSPGGFSGLRVPAMSTPFIRSSRRACHWPCCLWPGAHGRSAPSTVLP